MVALLPSSFTSTEEERQIHLDQMMRSAERYSHHHINYVWLAADDHPDFEKTFDIGFDLPALIVVDLKK